MRLPQRSSGFPVARLGGREEVGGDHEGRGDRPEAGGRGLRRLTLESPWHEGVGQVGAASVD
ncbi:hypothetical protein, partial [Clavibacter michiganensis]|uniref:hypothetical protein n=1 Tax=Clavibacter michiganensis TaxID=28447 RepID=UPI002930CA9C